MEELQRRLSTALASGDPTRARRVVNELGSGGSAEGGAAVLDELAARAAGGDEVALEILLERLDEDRVLHRFISGLLLDEAAIDDVAQDTLISIAGSIGSFSGRSKFTTWVHRVARNRTVDHLRRQRETAPLAEDPDLGPAQRMSSIIATRVSVQEALAQLPAKYRDPVTLRDVEGQSYQEVAERLALSVGTVKSQVSRGRAMLAATLAPPLPGGGE